MMGPIRCGRCVATLSFLLALTTANAASTKTSTPHFKWGQSKEMIFLSIMVKDLDEKSVAISLPTEGDISFEAKNSKGDRFSLALPLREDVKKETLKWEVVARPDKWGTVVLLTFQKVNAHRWDLLVTEPKKFKKEMDKDWSREDASLEPEDELPYIEDNSDVLTEATEKNLDKLVSKNNAVVVNLRYPWCTQCKSQDETFVKAAKQAKAKIKKDASWKKVLFAVVDAREQRALSRRLGAKCDFSCDYRVFTGVGEEPITMKSKFSEADLLSEIVKYTTPAVQALKTADGVEALKVKNTTCFGRFASESSPKYGLFKHVANLMRGNLVFAASFGEEGGLELWPQKQNFSFKYDGSWDDNGTALFNWIQPRSIPLVQEYDWSLRETYEKLGLPLAKIWINDEDKNPSFVKIVNHVLRRVAKKYIGRVAFVQQKKSTYSYELRDYGLNQPEVYPAFGIASNATYNAVKYGFEVSADIAASAQDFWKDADKAVASLTEFCEKVLAGTWPEAHESAAPQTNWTKGAVRKLVWKDYSEIQRPERPLLLEVYGKYRTDNDRKLKEVEHLAKALELHADSFTVATYDSGDNFVPPLDFKREKYASDTEWYWVPAWESGSASRPAMKKLMKPKKDAPYKNVIEFAKKQSGVAIEESEVMAKFDELMVADPPPTTTPPPPMADHDHDHGMEGMGGMPGMEGMGMPGMGGMPGMEGMGGMPGMGGGGMPDMESMMAGMKGMGGEL